MAKGDRQPAREWDKLPAQSFQRAPRPVTGVHVDKPGVKGDLPLPQNQAVPDSDAATADYLPEEITRLRKLGWEPGDPVPSDLPDILARAADPSGNIDFDKLPTEILMEAQVALARAKRDAASAAYRGEYRSAAVAAAAQGQVQREIPLDYGVGGEAAEPEPQVTAETEGEKRCLNCDFPLSRTDIAEVTENDTISYVASLMAGIPWQKHYILMDGKLQVIVRELRTQELEACGRQAIKELDDDPKAIVRNALFDQINRYRLSLQLLVVVTPVWKVELPDSLYEWQRKLGLPSPDGDGETNAWVLPYVLNRMQQKVLVTESMYRVLQATVARFNRTLARLEANVEHEGFYSATEPPDSSSSLRHEG